MKTFTLTEVRNLLNDLNGGEMSMSRFVEILNEKAALSNRLEIATNLNISQKYVKKCVVSFLGKERLKDLTAEEISLFRAHILLDAADAIIFSSQLKNSIKSYRDISDRLDEKIGNGIKNEPPIPSVEGLNVT